jgi:hypothetical protein
VPLIIPPFTQYQAPVIPLRGLWNAKPSEGDKLISAEVDWGGYPPGQAVQFSLSGNSPVAFSQIVALTIDNARCGSDVQFIFSDSGYILQVPSHCQGTFPVFTNSLNFYVVALNASPSDVTCFLVHNSMPPPVAMLPSSAQNSAAVAGVNMTNGLTQIIPATINGTLRGGSLILDAWAVTANQGAGIQLLDGRGVFLWSTAITTSTVITLPIALGNLAVRFQQGVRLQIQGNSFTSAAINVNLYYTVP